MSEQHSQEEAIRIRKIGDYKAATEAMRLYDWDGNFDYSRYPKEEIQRSKHDYTFYILESQIWKDKRAIRWLLDGYQCRSCGSELNLSVHHKRPSYKKLPYESIIFDLTTLCIGDGGIGDKSCHTAIENCILGRKYDQQPIVVEPHVSETRRIEGMDHGRSQNIEVSPHRNQSHYFPQRTASKPTQPVHESNERDQCQKE